MNSLSKKSRFIIAGIFSVMAPAFSFAQSDENKKNLSLSAYTEIFYSYDAHRPSNHIKQPFLYTYNRHNHFNVNLALLKASYEDTRVRGNIGLMAGTYANDNMAAEKDAFKNLYEANAGVKLSPRKKLWLDVGVLPSHIGWESAIGKDCPTLTRSIAAENSPYFETGARLSYHTDNEKWYFSALVLNSWQRIERVAGHHSPAFGHQLSFKPNAHITLNSSSFIGNDKPDSLRQMRYFHDFYGQFQWTKQFMVTLGFDMGMEQKFKGSQQFYTWYSPVVIANFMTEKWNLALRGEYYADKKGVMIPTGTTHGFQTLGYSLNLDRRIAENFVWRLEARGLNSRDKIFLNDDKYSHQNFFITSSWALSF